MNLRRVDLNLLTIFDAIMTEGSITRAAARLGMTQPALSNALTRLRRLVDDPLFVRVGNRIVPTARAEALALPVRQALDLAERALSGHPEETDREEIRVFTLAVGDVGETIALPHVLMRLRRETGRAPRLRLRCAPPETIENELGNGNVDLAWLVFPVSIQEVNSEPVMQDEFVCVVPAADADKQMTKERYLAIDHVVLGAEIAADVPGFGGWRRRRIAMEVHDYARLAALVATAGLAATLPKRLAQHYSATYGLAIQPLPFEMPPAIIHQAWPRALDRDSTHIRLRRAFKAAAM